MAATDDYSDRAAGSGPYRRAAAVAPSDSVSSTNVSRALWVGGAGNVTLVTAGGDVVTFTAVPAGTLLAVACSRVNATGTTATLIVALW